MSLLAFLLAFSLLSGDPSPRTGCGCRTVAPDQKPLGASMDDFEAVESPVSEIHGSVVFLFSEKPVDKAIVEVYEYPASVKNYREADDRKRFLACMTGRHGRFCFKGLPPGRYLLRAGVSNHYINAFNYYFVEVTVADKGSGRTKKISIELTVAT